MGEGSVVVFEVGGVVVVGLILELRGVGFGFVFGRFFFSRRFLG